VRSRWWRRWVVGGLVVIALVVGASAGVMRSKDGAGDSALTVAPEGLDLADLDPALLTAEDVDGDFAPTGDVSGTEMRSDVYQMSDECKAGLEQIGVGLSDRQWLQIGFERGADGSMITHEISLIDQGDPPLDDVGDVLDRCGTMLFEHGEVEGEVRVEEFNPIDGPGEDAIETVITIDTSQGELRAHSEGYAVVSARGGVRSRVSLLDTESPDRDLVSRLAQAADRKVERALQE
jgi:hypothetical protein